MPALILLSLLTANTELFPYEGRPIVSIEVKGPDGENLDLVRSLLDIQPGYLFSTADLSRGVRRVFALGRFSDVAVRVSSMGVALVLRVEVSIQAVIGELTFSGDVDPEIVRELRGVLPPQQAIDDALLLQVQRRVEKLWEGSGFPQAKCTLTQHRGTRQRVDLNIHCAQGTGSHISRIEFTGRPKARDYQLLKEMTLAPGGLFAERRLKSDEKALRAAYFKRGFLQASIKLDVMKEARGVALRYAIDAGPHVSTRVIGNSHFSDKELLGLLKRDPDEPLTAGVLDAWRRAVVERYVQHGYTFAKATLQPHADSAREVVHQVLSIEEGKRYHVETITFPGAAFFSEQRLREEVVAFVNQRLDPALLSGEVNPSAVRALEDGGVGIKSPPHVRAPAFDHWLYRIDPDQLYEPEAYNQAEDAIRRLYLEQGFTRVEVGPLQLERDDLDGKLTTRIPVREGPRALVTALIFSGSNALEVTEMLDLAKLAADQPFSELAVEETRNAVQKSLAQRGYLYARVEPTVDLDPTMTQASVRFSVSDGPQVFVSRVLIQGNDETKESVIRDRVLLEPDKPYSPELAQSTKDEVQRLEVFDSTNVGLADPDVPAEQKDVLIRLIQRKTQSLVFSLGVSTAQGIRGYIEYNDKNFANLAQQLTVRAQVNQQLFFSPIFYTRYAKTMERRFYDFVTSVRPYTNGKEYDIDMRGLLLQSIEHMLRVGWRTPRSLKLPGRPQLYAEAANERLNTLAFSLDSLTLLAGVDMNPVPQLRTVIETSAALNALQCDFGDAASPGGTDTSACDIRNLGRTNFVAEGTFVNWKSGPTLYIDLRDNPLNARSGFLGVLKTDLVIGQQIATRGGGALPVDPRYAFIKAEAQLTGYIPAGKRASFALSGRLGNIFRVSGDEALVRTQLNELFFLGGKNTLRAYFEQSVLPQDACLVNPNDATPKKCARPENTVKYNPGGTDPPPVSPGAFYYILKGEFRFPVLGDFVAGSVFIDAGNLYYQASNFQPLAILWNVGAGVRFQTPVGALAVDLGLNPFPRTERGETVVALPYIYVGLF